MKKRPDEEGRARVPQFNQVVPHSLELARDVRQYSHVRARIRMYRHTDTLHQRTHAIKSDSWITCLVNRSHHKCRSQFEIK